MHGRKGAPPGKAPDLERTVDGLDSLPISRENEGGGGVSLVTLVAFVSASRSEWFVLEHLLPAPFRDCQISQNLSKTVRSVFKLRLLKDEAHHRAGPALRL